MTEDALFFVLAELPALPSRRKCDQCVRIAEDIEEVGHQIVAAIHANPQLTRSFVPKPAVLHAPTRGGHLCADCASQEVAGWYDGKVAIEQAYYARLEMAMLN
jgi:hypothetical protein